MSTQPSSIEFSPGDSLGKLADRYLGDVGNWRELADFNNLDIFSQIPQGLPIQIPDADQLRSLLQGQIGQLANELPDLSSVAAGRFSIDSVVDVLEEVKVIDWLY